MTVAGGDVYLMNITETGSTDKKSCVLTIQEGEENVAISSNMKNAFLAYPFKQFCKFYRFSEEDFFGCMWILHNQLW